MGRANKKWSEDEDRRLLALFETGRSLLEIGREIDRTAEAVRSRLELFGIPRLKRKCDEGRLVAGELSFSAHRSQANALVDELHRTGLSRSGRRKRYRLKARTREALAELLLKLGEALSSAGILITVSNHPDIDQELLTEFLETLEENGFVLRVPTNSIIDHARGNRSEKILKGSIKLKERLLRTEAPDCRSSVRTARRDSQPAQSRQIDSETAQKAITKLK